VTGANAFTTALSINGLMIDIVPNDKGCIPTITSSPAAAQSTTAPP